MNKSLYTSWRCGSEQAGGWQLLAHDRCHLAVRRRIRPCGRIAHQATPRSLKPHSKSSGLINISTVRRAPSPMTRISPSGRVTRRRGVPPAAAEALAVGGSAQPWRTAADRGVEEIITAVFSLLTQLRTCSPLSCPSRRTSSPKSRSPNTPADSDRCRAPNVGGMRKHRRTIARRCEAA